jgi:hypothetical protein
MLIGRLDPLADAAEMMRRASSIDAEDGKSILRTMIP